MLLQNFQTIYITAFKAKANNIYYTCSIQHRLTRQTDNNLQKLQNQSPCSCNLYLFYVPLHCLPIHNSISTATNHCRQPNCTSNLSLLSDTSLEMEAYDICRTFIRIKSENFCIERSRTAKIWHSAQPHKLFLFLHNFS